MIPGRDNNNHRRWAARQLYAYCGTELLKRPEFYPDTDMQSGIANLVSIQIPDWAREASIDGILLVPEWASPDCDWRTTDWLGAAWWFLVGSAERDFEREHGPIHSYASRLRGLDPRMWEYAWVNRIGWFLRLRMLREDASLLRETPFPRARILLTHDVDAIQKTLPTRLKQTAFGVFNAIRELLRGRPAGAINTMFKSLRFALTPANYDCFDKITTAEEAIEAKSVFLFYSPEAAGPVSVVLRWLMDPRYALDDAVLADQLPSLVQRGHVIGLHPGFGSWRDADALSAGRSALAAASGQEVRIVRQHWLRFSWEHTWLAQARAGFEVDLTLGFNDRPGFRIGAALPVDVLEQTEHHGSLTAIPTVLMDSHFFDYDAFKNDEDRFTAAQRWLDEVISVGGCAALIWHQRVFSEDYGWGDLYNRILKHYRDFFALPALDGKSAAGQT